MSTEAQNLQAGTKISYMGEEWLVQEVADVTGSDTTCRIRAANVENPLQRRSWIVSKTRLFEEIAENEAFPE